MKKEKIQVSDLPNFFLWQRIGNRHMQIFVVQTDLHISKQTYLF